MLCTHRRVDCPLHPLFLRPADVQLRCPPGVLALLSACDQNISLQCALYFNMQVIIMPQKCDSSPQCTEWLSLKPLKTSCQLTASWSLLRPEASGCFSSAHPSGHLCEDAQPPLPLSRSDPCSLQLIPGTQPGQALSGHLSTCDWVLGRHGY